MHFGRTVLFKQTTTNQKDFSHIYLPCYFTWFTRPHLCFLTNAVLKKNPSSSPAQAVVNFPTLFFALLQKGTLNASLDKNYCRLNLLKSWLWFSFQV